VRRCPASDKRRTRRGLLLSDVTTHGAWERFFAEHRQPSLAQVIAGPQFLVRIGPRRQNVKIVVSPNSETRAPCEKPPESLVATYPGVAASAKARLGQVEGNERQTSNRPKVGALRPASCILAQLHPFATSKDAAMFASGRGRRGCQPKAASHAESPNTIVGNRVLSPQGTDERENLLVDCARTAIGIAPLYYRLTN